MLSCTMARMSAGVDSSTRRNAVSQLGVAGIDFTEFHPAARTVGQRGGDFVQEAVAFGARQMQVVQAPAPRL